MSLQDFQIQPVRSSAALTTSYVAGTIIDGARQAGVNDMNQLILLIEFTKASTTSLEYKIEGAIAITYSLAYDGQTANFTVGETITGAKSGATATVYKDTDSGASGTLYLQGVKGTFHDNETITGSSTGIAVVNGAIALSDEGWYQQTQSTISGGTSTIREIEHTIVTANQSAATQRYAYAMETKYNYLRVSFKCTGTATSSACACTAILGVV
jgi:hypothetical protein